MPYALVCLVGDENTQRIERSAREFARVHPPHGEILTPHPRFDEVKQAVADASGNALLTAHNGGGNVRGTSKGQPWAVAAQFGEIFRGARVYVYACETLGEGGEESLSSLGHEAVRAGVRCFAGHCLVVPTDNAASGIDAVLHAMWKLFLEGEDNQASIQGAGWRAYRGIPKRVRGGTVGFSLMAGALSAAIHALRVIPTPDAAAPDADLPAG